MSSYNRRHLIVLVLSDLFISGQKSYVNLPLSIVAKEDMYLDTSWGEVQFVAKGGLVTFMGEEAIGNNNPCDLVLRDGDKKASMVLTSPSYNIRKNYEACFGKKPEGAVEEFLQVTAGEDRKNPYLQRGLSNSFQR